MSVPKETAHTWPHGPSHCVLKLHVPSSSSSSEPLMWDPWCVRALLTFVESLQTATQWFASHMCKETVSNHSQITNHKLGLSALCGTKSDSTTKRQKIVLQGGWYGWTKWDADKGKASDCTWEAYRRVRFCKASSSRDRRPCLGSDQ